MATKVAISMGGAPKILIFDSGVGGLSILQEVRRQLPDCTYIYACDNRAFPYGTKEEQALVQRVDQVLNALIRRVHPDLVVVACNTASTVALPRIRAQFSKPVVGVVPAIKPAALHSASKTIGLLGTPGTVNRPYTQQLINEFAADCTVIKIGSSVLVELAEAKLRGAAVDLEQLGAIIAPFFNTSELDTIVLACTHFPLLLEELSAAAPRQVSWIDSGNAIARRVASLLPAKTTPSNRTSNEFLCLLTEAQPGNRALFNQIAPLGCGKIDIVPI